jgi:hypothetical protein
MRLTAAGLLGRAEMLGKKLPQAEVSYSRRCSETDIHLSEASIC